MTLDETIALLLGVAFSARTLDGKKNIPVRIGYGLVGYDLLSHALRDKAPGTPSAIPGSTSGMGYADATTAPATAKLTASGEKTVNLNFKERRVRNIQERVNYIVQQMQVGTRDPRIYSLARSVLSRKTPNGSWAVPEKDAWAEACALFAEVKQRVRYTWDPTDYDAFQTPGKTLELKTGDCDDACSLLGAMLRTIGHQVACRVVHTKGFETWNHIYLRVKLPTGEWRTLDTTVAQPPGWEVPRSMMLKDPVDFVVNEKGKPNTNELTTVK